MCFIPAMWHFIWLRDRELNRILLNTSFLNERKWQIQYGGLKPKVDSNGKTIIFVSTLDSNEIPTAIPIVSGPAHNGTCIYTVRLNWEETGSEKSKMTAYTHEMRLSQLPD